MKRLVRTKLYSKGDLNFLQRHFGTRELLNAGLYSITCKNYTYNSVKIRMFIIIQIFEDTMVNMHTCREIKEKQQIHLRDLP